MAGMDKGNRGGPCCNKGRFRVAPLAPPKKLSEDVSFTPLEIDGDIVGLRLTIEPEPPDEGKLHTTMDTVMERLEAGERKFDVCLFQGYMAEVTPGEVIPINDADALILNATMSILSQKKHHGEC